MALKKSPRSASVILPGRQWVTRASLLLLVTCSLALTVMSKTGNPGVARLRNGVMDMLAPVLAATASPLDSVASAGSWLRDVVAMQAENRALREQNAQLLRWQAAAKDMQAENTALRALLHAVPVQQHTYITARVVSDASGPYVHSALINAGQENGIRKDQPVLSENGLIGRVVDAGKVSATVLLLNDINSRVPVMGEISRQRGILVGNNNALPIIAYANGKMAAGERIITSGDGGVFPAGIPVGVVNAVEQGEARVQPFADAQRVEIASVLDAPF